MKTGEKYRHQIACFATEQAARMAIGKYRKSGVIEDGDLVNIERRVITTLDGVATHVEYALYVTGDI